MVLSAAILDQKVVCRSDFIVRIYRIEPILPFLRKITIGVLKLMSGGSPTIDFDDEKIASFWGLNPYLSFFSGILGLLDNHLNEKLKSKGINPKIPWLNNKIL